MYCLASLRPYVCCVRVEIRPAHFLRLPPSLPCHDLLNLSGAVSQNKSFLPYFIYTRAFYPRNRKKKSRLQLQAQGKEGTTLTLNIDYLNSRKTLATRLEQITKFLFLFLPKTHLTINDSHCLAGEG